MGGSRVGCAACPHNIVGSRVGCAACPHNMGGSRVGCAACPHNIVGIAQQSAAPDAGRILVVRFNTITGRPAPVSLGRSALKPTSREGIRVGLGSWCLTPAGGGVTIGTCADRKCSRPARLGVLAEYAETKFGPKLRRFCFLSLEYCGLTKVNDMTETAQAFLTEKRRYLRDEYPTSIGRAISPLTDEQPGRVGCAHHFRLMFSRRSCSPITPATERGHRLVGKDRILT